MDEVKQKDIVTIIYDGNEITGEVASWNYEQWGICWVCIKPEDKNQPNTNINMSKISSFKIKKALIKDDQSKQKQCIEDLVKSHKEHVDFERKNIKDFLSRDNFDEIKETKYELPSFKKRT